MKHRNAIFLLIDSLRYDVVSMPDSLRAIAPNLARIAEKGFARRVVANAQSTQFVMPSLFSQSYPLDHGGYNNGIRERPASFVECLSEAGYHSHLVSACNQIGITLGFNRGFGVVHAAVDYRHILSYRIDKALRYEIELVASGEKTEEEALSVLVPELDGILEAICNDVASSDTTIWPKRLRRINLRVAQLCEAERDLLEKNPKVVLSKLRRLRPTLYWRCLGLADFGRIDRFRWRAATAIDWRLRAMAKNAGFPLFPLGHFQVLAGDLFGELLGLLSAFQRPWFIYLHLMDAHDSASVSRPLHLLGRLRYLPRWLAARRRGLTARTFLYDSALMYIDAQIGKMIEALTKSGTLEDTLIVATGDHGFSAAGSPRASKKDLGHRTHAEDIDVGLICSEGAARNNQNTLVDSMGVSATLLELLGVTPDPSFKGKSAFGPGRDAVISENAGRGNADLDRRDLYFTVTTRDFKLMATLRGADLSCQELYDLRDDPQELNNRIDDSELQPAASTLIGYLFAERRDLLAARGAHSADAERAMSA